MSEYQPPPTSFVVIPPEGPARRERRQPPVGLILGVVAALLVAAGGVWFFAMRDDTESPVVKVAAEPELLSDVDACEVWAKATAEQQREYARRVSTADYPSADVLRGVSAECAVNKALTIREARQAHEPKDPYEKTRLDPATFPYIGTQIKKEWERCTRGLRSSQCVTGTTAHSIICRQYDLAKREVQCFVVTNKKETRGYNMIVTVYPDGSFDWKFDK